MAYRSRRSSSSRGRRSTGYHGRARRSSSVRRTGPSGRTSRGNTIRLVVTQAPAPTIGAGAAVPGNFTIDPVTGQMMVPGAPARKARL